MRFVNDADAFLLGEWWTGAARGHERAVGITLGTGLGSAFLERGRILPAGELYLAPFRGGPVEDIVSGRGLLARYGSAAGGVEELVARARGGEARARSAFDDVFSALAEFLLPRLTEFGATCLVVGGRVARAWNLIEPILAPTLRSATSLVCISRAADLEDAALLGAARRAAS